MGKHDATVTEKIIYNQEWQYRYSMQAMDLSQDKFAKAYRYKIIECQQAAAEHYKEVQYWRGF